MNKIKLGLPKGSLNTIGRGNTYEVFDDAGYDIKGYEPGKEQSRITIENDPEIIAFRSRPQSAPVELSRELLDIAIIGEDWVREYSYPSVQKIGDLEYGPVRLVVAVPDNSPYGSLSEFFMAQKGRKKPILCFTEYVNLTRRKFMANKGYREVFGSKKPLMVVRELSNGDNESMQIIFSDGATEEFIAKGADIIVDNSQTGESLKNYKLREIEQIMKSSAGLYAGPSCTGWKETKANEIFEQLYGVIAGKRRFDVKFNVPNEKLESVREYLISEKLCSDEPTVSEGRKFSTINILIPRKTFPAVKRTLKKEYNASAIVRGEIKQFIE